MARLNPLFRQVGVRHVGAEAPAVVTLEWLQRECEALERILRLQYPEGRLPAKDEAALAALPPKKTTAALKRWAYLKCLYARRSEEGPSGSFPDPISAG